MALESNSKIWIQIRRVDLGQVIEGIETLIEQWRDTGRFLSGEDAAGVVRECGSAEEAHFIAAYYDRIAANLTEQLLCTAHSVKRGG